MMKRAVIHGQSNLGDRKAGREWGHGPGFCREHGMSRASFYGSAKNYLVKEELGSLGRIVNAWLDLPRIGPGAIFP